MIESSASGCQVGRIPPNAYFCKCGAVVSERLSRVRRETKNEYHGVWYCETLPGREPLDENSRTLGDVR